MGGRRPSIRSWARGSCGARKGANSAARATTNSQAAESHSLELRLRLRVPGPACAVVKVVSAMAQSWVQEAIGQVDRQVHQDEDAGEGQHDALDKRQVTVDDRVDGHIAQALVCKEALDDDGAPDQKGELHAYQGKGGQGGVAQGFAQDDLDFGEAAHSGQHGVVLLEYFFEALLEQL